jgi:GDP-fucose protein O-fucosyltransferase
MTAPKQLILRYETASLPPHLFSFVALPVDGFDVFACLLRSSVFIHGMGVAIPTIHLRSIKVIISPPYSSEPIKRRKLRKRRYRSHWCASSLIPSLGICCTIGLLAVLLIGVLIYYIPEEQQDDTRYIDRGEAFGGWRPILPSDLRVGKLQCDAYGGPIPTKSAQEMVYWQNIREDHTYKSKFYDEYESSLRYLTFELDGGGFNNVRMAFETVVAMAHAMGRVLVLPPAQEVYLLYKESNKSGKEQKQTFDVTDFFPIRQISERIQGLTVITMEEFLSREALVGNIRDRQTGGISFPPHNRTNWDGDTDAVISDLNPWLEQVTYMPNWNPDLCVAAFPISRDPDDAISLEMRWRDMQISGGFPDYRIYIGHPTPVYAGAYERMAESMNSRDQLCIYNNTLVHEPFLHFHGKVKWGGRLLVQFYSFLFFEDWRQDLWTKRFIRDNVRYNDEIQCAAARVVAAIRDRVRQRNATKNQRLEGQYDAFHIRRGEFQYKKTRVSAQEIYDITKDLIPEGATVYIATDELNKEFFNDLAKHFDLVYLDDFTHLLDGMNTNYYGMIDQLVASRSRTFFGCWFST